MSTPHNSGQNVNVVPNGDHDPRNIPGMSPWLGSDRVVDDGSKPKRLTGSSWNSDWAFQGSFENVPSPNASAYFRYVDRERDVPLDAIPYSRERQVAGFVLEYLRRAGSSLDTTPEHIEAALQDGDRSASEFLSALSDSATNLHIASSIDRGTGPGMKSSSDSVIPISVQETVQILPQTRRKRKLVSKTAWNDRDLVGHGKSVAKRTYGVADPSHPDLKLDPKQEKDERQTTEKHEWAQHHVEQGKANLVRVANEGARKLAHETSKLVEGVSTPQRPEKPPLTLAEEKTPADVLELVNGKFNVQVHTRTDDGKKATKIESGWTVSKIDYEFVNGEGWVKVAYITNTSGNTHPVRAESLIKWNKKPKQEIDKKKTFGTFGSGRI